jgi:hypothetical protein
MQLDVSSAGTSRGLNGLGEDAHTCLFGANSIPNLIVRTLMGRYMESSRKEIGHGIFDLDGSLKYIRHADVCGIYYVTRRYRVVEAQNSRQTEKH